MPFRSDAEYLISIHALREEGDCSWAFRRAQSQNFYPRPPRGGRRQMCRFSSMRQNFYPRPPRGGRPTTRCYPTTTKIFLSTPSARRATILLGILLRVPLNFYPRPPRGGRPRSRHQLVVILLFLSTPSARRATLQSFPFCGQSLISIHALREEGDARIVCAWPTSFIFLSTPSARRATYVRLRHLQCHSISIHALREEGDADGRRTPCQAGNFYPRPPRGGRQQKQRQNLYFQTNYTTFCTNLEEP